MTTTITKTCRDCGNTFVIKPDELAWLQEKGLQVYSRCPDCRKKNRAKRQEAPSTKISELIEWITTKQEDAARSSAQASSEELRVVYNAHFIELDYIINELMNKE